jgi:hypothetical protein
LPNNLSPPADCERRQTDEKQDQRIGTDHTGTAEPQCGYREDCDTGGLEHRALLGWRKFACR